MWRTIETIDQCQGQVLMMSKRKGGIDGDRNGMKRKGKCAARESDADLIPGRDKSYRWTNSACCKFSLKFT
jgi:hypothetical protein